MLCVSKVDIFQENVWLLGEAVHSWLGSSPRRSWLPIRFQFCTRKVCLGFLGVVAYVGAVGRGTTFTLIDIVSCLLRAATRYSWFCLYNKL